MKCGFGKSARMNRIMNVKKIILYSVTMFLLLSGLTGCFLSDAHLVFKNIGGMKPQVVVDEDDLGNVNTDCKQEKLYIAFDKLMAGKITHVHEVEHLWQLAPFIGKNVEIYGRAKIIKTVKNAEGFAINGKTNLMLKGISQILLESHGGSLKENKSYLESPFLIIKGRLCFNYLSRATVDKTWGKKSGYQQNGWLDLRDVEVKKVYDNIEVGKNKPDCIRESTPTKSAIKKFNLIFLGLSRDVSYESYAKFIYNNLKSPKQVLKQKANSQSSEQFSVANRKISDVSELIPYLGTYVEIRGRLVKSKTDSNVCFLILNENKKISISTYIPYENNDLLEKFVICRCYIFLRKHKKTEKLCIAANFPEYETQKSKPVGTDYSFYRIRKLPLPEFLEKDRRSFVTGFYYDANYINFRKYITGMIKQNN